MPSDADLLVGIPTVLRPEAVRRTLGAVAERVTVPHDVLVVDATPGGIDMAVYADADAEVISNPSLAGPAASQRFLAREAVSGGYDYLHVLHDDILPREGAVARLYERVADGPADVAGGVCHDPDGSTRPMGRDYRDARTDGRKRVVKEPYYAEAFSDPLPVDHPEPMVVIDVDVFGEPGADAPGVMYDPAYEFLLEQWDFYMQAREAGLRVEGVPDAHFDHHDDPFEGETARDRQDLLADKAHFSAKWGVWPGRESP